MIQLPGWLEDEIRRYNHTQEVRNAIEEKRILVEEERNVLIEGLINVIINKQFFRSSNN